MTSLLCILSFFGLRTLNIIPSIHPTQLLGPCSVPLFVKSPTFCFFWLLVFQLFVPFHINVVSFFFTARRWRRGRRWKWWWKQKKKKTKCCSRSTFFLSSNIQYRGLAGAFHRSSRFSSRHQYFSLLRATLRCSSPCLYLSGSLCLLYIIYISAYLFNNLSLAYINMHMIAFITYITAGMVSSPHLVLDFMMINPFWHLVPSTYLKIRKRHLKEGGHICMYKSCWKGLHFSMTMSV